MQIIKLSPTQSSHFTSLLKIFADVFEIQDLTLADEAHLANMLENQDFFVIVATQDGIVIGGLTVYVLHSYYSSQRVAYIYDVGVHKDFQRKGVGMKLMNYLLDYCKENGFKSAYVEAETDDLDAIRFYKKSNSSSILQATHFTYLTN